MILVAHGDRGGEGANGALHAQAERLSRTVCGRDVVVGLLNGHPSLEDAVARVRHCARVDVFPLLMSEGYFTDTVIPSRLDPGAPAERFVLHRPLGCAQALTSLVEDEALAGALKLGFSPKDVTVLLAGHGAKSNTRARLAIEVHADRLRHRAVFGRIDTTYLEEPPFLADALAGLTGPTVVVGMFISDGLHAAEDVPEAMRRAVHVPAFYTGAIGAHPAVSKIVADML